MIPKQNTPEWHIFRREKIGASDAPVIMCENPWRTPLQLFEEKVGFRNIQENEAMKRGKELEPIARQKFIEYTGIEVEDKVLIHPEHSWMIASLDGIDKSQKHIVEIKCPGQKTHEEAKSGIIPKIYRAQLQHQMEVAQLDKAFYFSYYEFDCVLLEIHRDDNYIKIMIEKEMDFWNCVQTFTPPDPIESDYKDRRTDLTFILAEDDYLSAKKKRMHWEDEEVKMKDVLISMAKGENCRGNNIKVCKVTRKGNIDYSLVPQLHEINLEPYRKNPTESWRII
jgi:putative phage-type endonuclease